MVLKHQPPLLLALAPNQSHFCYNGVMIEQIKGRIENELGPSSVIPPATVAKQLADASNDMQISEMVRGGATYVDIASYLGISVAAVINRIASMLNREYILSEDQLNDYIAHQLRLSQIAIDNCLADMACEADPPDITASVASKTRQNGRLSLVKFLEHEAKILGLLRTRIDIHNETTVAVAVVRAEDFDAL